MASQELESCVDNLDDRCMSAHRAESAMTRYCWVACQLTRRGMSKERGVYSRARKVGCAGEKHEEKAARGCAKKEDEIRGTRKVWWGMRGISGVMLNALVMMLEDHNKMMRKRW